MNAGSLQDLIIAEIPHLQRYALALLRDTEAADDLVQDCLARAMDRLYLWRPGSNMRHWLFAILHNLHVNERRRHAKRPDAVALAPGHENLYSTPPAQSAGLELRDIDSALAQLVEDQRQVLLLIGLEGLSYAEAADVLDIPEGTVMSRLNRGRQRLRELLEQPPPASLRRVK